MSVRLSCFLLISVILAVSCREPEIVVPSEFRISLESNGGFTGGGSGYDLFSDGRLRVWNRATVSSDRNQWEIEVGAERVRDLARGLLLTPAMGWQSRATGNITSRLTWATGDSVRQWTWAWSELPEGAPSELVAWEKELRTWLRQIRDDTKRGQER